MWFKEKIREDPCRWDVFFAAEDVPSLEACSRHWIGSLPYYEQEQNALQRRADLALDLLSLRVKFPLWFEFNLVKSTPK